MTTLRYRPGPEVTASPLTGLGGHGGQCPHRAARGGDQLAVERPLHRHQSLLDARGSRFYRPGGDEDDVAQEARIGFVTAVRCYRDGRGPSLRGFAALCSARQPSARSPPPGEPAPPSSRRPCPERPPSAPGPPCSAGTTWSIWRSRVSSCGNSALREQGRHRDAGRALETPYTRLDERRARSRSTLTGSSRVMCLRAPFEWLRACGADRREQTGARRAGAGRGTAKHRPWLRPIRRGIGASSCATKSAPSWNSCVEPSPSCAGSSTKHTAPSG
jgi:hypothetical protein